MARRRSRWASEAALQALVRFGPEQSGLKALEREAVSQARTTARTARGSAQTIIGEIDRARPEVKKAYDVAGLRAARAAHDISDPVLATLGPEAGSLKAAAALEMSGLKGRLAESRAGAVTELSNRRVQATQGAQFAISNARSELAGTLEKIFARQQDLRREKGAFTAATMGELREAARDRAQQMRIAEGGWKQQDRNSRRTQRNSERSSLRSAGINPDTGKPYKGGKLDPDGNGRRGDQSKGKGGSGGAGGATTEKHLEWQSAIEDISSAARRYKGKLSRPQIVEKLKSGRPQQQIETDPDTGEKLKTPVVLPGIPQYKADLKMTAALDIALDGHLSKATQRRLHRSGFSVEQLGLPSYGEWRRRAAGYEQRTGRPARG
jgi:hypothetical protein